ncbi:MAG: hypothetical protein H7195_11640, partial [Chryseobacterium sp.]|nr:hypothetical protein [Chryseobacterium sp.]
RDRMRHYNANYQLVVPNNFKVVANSDRISVDDDMHKDEEDSDPGKKEPWVKIETTENTIETSSDSDSIIINGKKVSKDAAESYVKKVILNPSNLNDVKIDVKANDNHSQINIKTK